MLFSSIAFAGCTTYEGKVESFNETDGTMVVSESYSFAKKLVSLLEELPPDPPEEEDSFNLNHTVWISIYEPGESGQKIYRGKDPRPQTRSTGYVQRGIRLRIKPDNTVTIFWLGGWGERNSRNELRGVSRILADAITGMGPYEPAPEPEGVKFYDDDR
jgi:hypothetical protein